MTGRSAAGYGKTRVFRRSGARRRLKNGNRSTNGISYPRRNYADAVIGIDYSEYGKALGNERNVYCVTLSQHRMKHTIENIDLSLDLYSILSLSERNFCPEVPDLRQRRASGWEN